MDGIFVALLNGARADYRTCCFLDYLKEAGGWTKGVPDKAKVEAIMGSPRLDQKVLEASRCAHQMMAIEINSLWRGGSNHHHPSLRTRPPPSHQPNISPWSAYRITRLGS